MKKFLVILLVVAAMLAIVTPSHAEEEKIEIVKDDASSVLAKVFDPDLEEAGTYRAHTIHYGKIVRVFHPNSTDATVEVSCDRRIVSVSVDPRVLKAMALYMEDEEVWIQTPTVGMEIVFALTSYRDNSGARKERNFLLCKHKK